MIVIYHKQTRDCFVLFPGCKEESYKSLIGI